MTRLTTKELAERLRTSPQHIREMRVRGDSPPYIKTAPNRVLYDLRDVEAWEAARRFTSTAAERAKRDANGRAAA